MLGIQDLLLTPVYLILIYLVAFFYRTKFVKRSDDKKYFIYGLSLKLIGALFLGIIYQFYYSGGDTFNYFHDIKYIFDLFFSSPEEALKLIFLDINNFNYQILQHTSNLYFSQDPSSYFLIRIGAILSVFSFGTYSIIGLFFAIISFSGLWKMYVTLIKIYPTLHKELAISIFFIPSVSFWGSGLMKDSLTLAALSFAFSYFLKYFILKERKTLYLGIILIMLFVLKSVKIYIALCFIPAALIYLFVYFNFKIRSRTLRLFIKPVFLVTGFTLAFLAISKLSETDSRYSLDNFVQTAKKTSSWISYVSVKEGGSYYTLGTYDASLSGMLKIAPSAVWVTLFRPYPWESKNIVMTLSSLESLIFLIFTLYVFRKGPVSLFRVINSDPYLQFALLFALTFSFAVGVSTYNFGSLVRYKTPMMSFYMSALFIINNYYKQREKKSERKGQRMSLESQN
ncbi:hypothetical protein [Sporocytophaga myxococcoides]|uniref:hypothetical protein n=1 Tax=Sporocytophaga myxococcoides TaxID=153721 RepID=UPI0004182EE5|nr:hypothetical protein [Sporocytophaga myxococcoides]